ncbi:nuclear transport factor 2 family protein [Cyclobacterium sp. 1_MG-2023]|uniref:nuclear transport factor 2 family protein n=1 Tax=Cyclobacterium sp. 1_MG-2023 TaxID=3062681 RepID=UPI0026E346E4|nr:nuclear transport factor 2 family protein [Cyclobacterium sp. 1_MG-2023]MDO6436108.1 nuclear transport factor 2 family protein [Cyclobacterium sp. 1_MG-2023]
MTKLTIAPDCGNSPKKAFLKTFNESFASGNATFICSHVSEDIVWKIHGDKTIKGKQKFTKEIHAMKHNIADELIIHSIITHGKEASVNGEIKMKNFIYAFCDVYRFTSAASSQIIEIQSYVIQTAP